MNINQLKEQYEEKKSEIDDLNNAVETTWNRILSTEKQIEQVSSRIQHVDGILKSAGQNIAGGMLSADGFIDLKEELAEKKIELTNLQEMLQALKNAKEISKKQHGNENRNLNQIKKNIASKLIEELIDELDKSLGEKLKKLFYLSMSIQNGMESDNKLNKQVSDEIGDRLSKKVFGISENNPYLPDFRHSWQQVDGYIAQES